MTVYTKYIALLTLAFVCCVNAAPIEKADDMLERVVETVLESDDTISNLKRKKRAEELDTIGYLSKYNYLPSTGASGGLGNIMTEDTYRDAIIRFQEFAGLPQTGEMDAATMETMLLPRCGVADIVDGVGDFATKRRKRYAVGGTKWGSTNLSYKINKYTSDMSASLVNSELHRALQVWEGVTPLRFTRETSGSVDIDIIFGARSHGDSEPFDGSGGTLAHAYFPQRDRIGGDAHFDDDETFTANSRNGINLFQVAAHEFGHSLGLSHSSNQNALMAPFYRGYQPNFVLNEDDVNGIQYLYGPNTVTTTTTTRQPPTRTTRRPVVTTTTTTTRAPPVFPGTGPSYCRSSKIDAITRDDDYTYIFKGDQFFVITSTGVASGYPRYISQDWSTLPNNIDAALYIKPTSSSSTGKGNTYIFKGDQVWKYVNRELIWQHPISDVVTGLPNNIDSAFVYPGNNRVYFTKGNQYYKLSTAGTAIERNYPRSLSTWWSNSGSNLQLSQINAAFTWTNDKLYFFRDERYYRFSPQQFKIEDNYPRNTDYWWFGCPANLEASDLQADPLVTENEDTSDEEDGLVVISTNEQNAQASGSQRLAISSVTLLSSIVLMTLAALLH